MKRNLNCFLRKVGDTYFLQLAYDLHRTEGKMVFLNETGAFLWDKLDECGSEEDLINALTAEYEVPWSVATQDVQAFLVFLQKNGCLESRE